VEEYSQTGRFGLMGSTNVKQYVVVLERTERNYGAYSPDLPGCVATGRTPEETLRRMREAVEMHVRGMEEDAQPLP
jgi:predicted RNase H-like HicB family nuclease